MNAAMGGFFELELPATAGEFHRDALRFQSPRAAFLALLEAGRPNAVWLPWFVCDAMLEPLRMSGISVRRYGLTATFDVDSANPGPNEWLVYVNYFGLCSEQVARTVSRFGKDRVVIDNSQAFFAAPADCVATIYSPRKFFGVPDGGYLITAVEMTEPEQVDDESMRRCAHLLHRLGSGPEPAYADFVAAENSLRELPPKRMSLLTQRLLSSIRYDDVRAQRASNFAFLHERLASFNAFDIDASGDLAPLCYPLQLESRDASFIRSLRDALRQRRIYTPTYWPGIGTDAHIPAFDASLPDAILALPCDQRLTRGQCDELARFIIEKIA